MIKTTNQQPQQLNCLALNPLNGNFDPYKTVRDNVIAPLYAPLVPSSPVKITDGKDELTPDDITSKLFDCCGDNVEPAAESFMKEFFAQTLATYDKSLSIQDVYAVQSAKKVGMLMPSDKVIYTPTDIIDASKQFLSAQLTYDSFFANFAFYTRTQAVGYYFANEIAFDEFKAWFKNEISNIAFLLSIETKQLCDEFMLMKLSNLTEGLILRDASTQNNEDYSFARIISFYLTNYAMHVKTINKPVYTMGMLPFNLSETFCPSIILLINIEKHAHAHPADIKKEWDIINNSILAAPKILSINKIQSLTAVARMAKKMSSPGFSGSGDVAKQAIMRFRKTAPSQIDMYKYIQLVYNRATNVLKSENATKYLKKTYQRPSRREPDNPDRQGVYPGTKYRPDLHIYLDTSGSISEREYQDGIKSCIKFAKKMNINIFFNSFSHVMSDCVKLNLTGKNEKQIYKEFQRVPKVDGGTNYEQIWHYINKSAKRRREISLIISDFEYHAPNHFVRHPRWLYYMPISTYSWSNMCCSANDFAKSMLGICSDIRKHILM